MCCNLPIETGVRAAEADCKCYNAVMTMYKSLRNVPKQVVLEAAQKVYRFHHPEDSKHDAMLTVERWIAAENVH